jgi:SAM-dependent methyltransferase
MSNSDSNNCPLCSAESDVFFERKKQKFFICRNCDGIFPDRALIPDSTAEKSRYEEHINDVENEGYQKFVSPIVSSILQEQNSRGKGLDFGAGTGPVISKLLKEKGFQILQYDPFFHNYPELLKDQYDYIVCCEVIEHFNNPPKEFQLLKSMLRPGGKVYCMTDLYNPSIEFDNWYYKNDITHVFIYQEKTIHYITERFQFSDLKIEGRLIRWTG